MIEQVGADEELLTLDELCQKLEMSVRNVRFYTARGLVPSPIRRGRSGFYSEDHVARLQLVSELQAHGFTLAAIERYVSRIPDDAPAPTIGLYRALLAPWMAELPETITTAELDRRAGRPLTEAEIDTLGELNVLAPAGTGKYDVALAHLDAGLKLLRLGYPSEAARKAKAVYEEHAKAIADAMTEIFREDVWPVYRSSDADPEELMESIEVLKPLSIAGIVGAYEKAMNEIKRDQIARRAR